MKKIFKPEQVGELLQGWLLHAHKGRDRHDEASRRLNRNRTALGIGTIVFSALAGLSSVVVEPLPSSWRPWVSLSISICGFTAALLASIQTFLRYEERIEQHHLAGARYKNTIRALEQVMIAPHSESLVTHQWLDDFRRSLDKLDSESPVVPRKVYDRIEGRFIKAQPVTHAFDLYN